jgi:hypothetical protein
MRPDPVAAGLRLGHSDVDLTFRVHHLDRLTEARIMRHHLTPPVEHAAPSWAPLTHTYEQEDVT